MGFWTGIKHALNSTLGTSYFRPLNDIVDRELLSSGNYYRTISNIRVELGEKGETVACPYSIKMFCNGTISINANLDSNRSDGAHTLRCDVLHLNGTTTDYSTETVHGEDNYYMRLNNIVVKKGDILTFSITENSTFGNDITSMEIYADEVQSSLFEVSE